MDEALTVGHMEGEQDRRISEAIRLEWTRLRNFIRKRVADPSDAEDILQDVFYELIEAHRLMKPVEPVVEAEGGGLLMLEDLLPSTEDGPDAAYARGLLLEELEEALNELPEEQRAVFIAHELDGQSFKEIAAETGVGVNTLLSRKRYAVLHLRRRLQAIYDEFMER